jgi:hypothetical protein
MLCLHPAVTARSLKVNFSNVKFKHIAPLVDLDPKAGLRDIGLFGVHRARLSNEFFAKMLDDICVAVDYYGPFIAGYNREVPSQALLRVSSP